MATKWGGQKMSLVSQSVFSDQPDELKMNK